MKGKPTTAHSSHSQGIPGAKKSQSQSGTSVASQPRQAPSVPISVYRDLAQELKMTKQKLLTLTSDNQILRQQNQSLRQEVTQVIASVAALQRMVQTMDAQGVHSVHQSTQVPAVRSSRSQQRTQDVSDPISHQQSPSASGYQSSSNGVTDELIAELDRTLAAQIGSPTTDALSQDREPLEAIALGPFCEIDPARLAQSIADKPSPDTVIADKAIANKAIANKAIANKAITDKAITDQALSPQISEEAAAQFFTEKPVNAPDAIALDQHESQSKPVSKMWLVLTLLVVVISAFSAGFLIMLPFLNRNSAPSDSETSHRLILPQVEQQSHS